MLKLDDVSAVKILIVSLMQYYKLSCRILLLLLVLGGVRKNALNLEIGVNFLSRYEHLGQEFEYDVIGSA